MRITDVFVRKGLLTAEQLAEVLRLQQTEGVRFDRAIVRLGYLSERELLAALAEHLNLKVTDLSQLIIGRDVLRLLPAKLVFRKRLFPVARDDGALEVAISDAFDTSALDEVRLLTGLAVRPVLAPADEIDKLIKAHYGVGGDTIDEMVAGEASGASAEIATNGPRTLKHVSA